MEEQRTVVVAEIVFIYLYVNPACLTVIGTRRIFVFVIAVKED